MYIDDLMLRVDMKEPILVEWVLDRLEDFFESYPEKALRIEEQLFNDTAIEYMIHHFDEMILSRIFQMVSPIRFFNNVELLTKKWPQWQDAVACWSAPIIGSCNAESAFELFRNECQKADPLFEDLNKWHGILKAMTLLPEDRAKTLSEIIIDTYRKFTHTDDVKHVFSLYLAAMAWTYDHSDFETFFREHLVPLPKSQHKGKYAERLKRLISVFDFSSMEYDLICVAMEGIDKPLFECLNFFYHKAIPSKEMENAVNHLKTRSFEFISSFFESYGSVIENPKTRRFLKTLIDDRDFMNRLHRKRQQPYVYAMILACMMASLRKDTLDFSSVSMEEAVAMVSSDIELLPDLNGFIAYFKDQDKEKTIRSLSNALNDAVYHFGGGHIISVMGALGYDAFLKPVMDALSSNPGYAFICSPAERALVDFGEKTLDFLTAHFEDLDDAVKISALTIAPKIGGSKAVQFIESHFDAYWMRNKEELLRACEALCHEPWRKRLEDKTNKGQTLTDRTYLLLTLLNDKKTAETDLLIRQYYETQAEQNRIAQAFITGNLMETVKPFVEAELRCKNCGDETVYRLHRIIVTHQAKGQPYIAEELRCLNCKLISEFEFTPRGLMALSGELMRLMLFASDEEKRKAYEQSPIEIIPFISHGKITDIGEAIEEYQAAIASNPKDAENHIRLGKIFYQTHQHLKSTGCLSKAMELDPYYLEPYVLLAQMASNAGRSDDALKHLEQGLPYITSAKYLKGFTSQIAEFINNYCDLYNSLSNTLKKDNPLIHPSDFTVKANVGRNDPCPCGSGKKYKKCCLMKSHRTGAAVPTAL